MSAPCVSVIIPCYNMELYVEECLDSLCNQSLREIEAICIDDGSTDKTGEILDRYQKQDPRIKVVHQSNRGVAAARNRGLEIATGEFIAFLDPDDFYPNSETMALLYSKAIENGALICGGSFSNYNNANGKIRTYFGGDYAKYSFYKEGFVNYRDYQFDFGYHRFLYRREFLAENNLRFPLYIRFQDPPFFIRAMIAAEKFYAIPDVVYRYRKGIQVSATTWPEPKLHDMMRGYLDDLIISREHQLAQLHALTIRRFEEDSVFIPVMNSLKNGNETTAELLRNFNDAVSVSLLRESGLSIPENEPYMLRHYKELARTVAPSKLSAYINRVKGLISLTLQDCATYGFAHTVRVIIERLTF